MARLSRILDSNGDRIPMRDRRKIDAQSTQQGYDILRREHETDHWKYANSLASSALDTYEVLLRLRRLCRSEFRNNPHLKGLILKMGHEVIGTGPQLEVIPDNVTKKTQQAANRVEKFFADHACEIRMTQKLRVRENEKKVGGESFSVFRRNPGIKTVPVDFEVYEGDQFHTPGFLYEELYAESEYPPVDGIKFDDWGNVQTYHRLRQHPHGRYSVANTYADVDHVAAEYCVHDFRKERPSQYRGVPECIAPLQIYAYIRRFIESKVGQEELRSKMLGAIQSKYVECADIGDEPIEMLIGDGQFLTLPDGWEAEMFRFDATGQGVAEFMKVALSWATQAFLVPWNVAVSDSSDSNFASGRLDHLLWNRIVDDRRDDIEKYFLRRYFAFWFGIASDMGQISSHLGPFSIKWHWPEREPIDIKAQSVADTNYAKHDLLDEDKFAQRRGSNAIELARKKMKLAFEKEKMKRELSEEYGFELPETKPEKEPANEPEPANAS